MRVFLPFKVRRWRLRALAGHVHGRPWLQWKWKWPYIQHNSLADSDIVEMISRSWVVDSLVKDGDGFEMDHRFESYLYIERDLKSFTILYLQK